MGFESCARVLLVVVNIVFTVIGLALLAAGVILKFFPSLYEPYLDEIEALIPTFSSDVGIEGVTESASATESLLDLGSIFGPVGIALLVFGIFVTLVGGFGLFGACCKVKVLLIIYTIVVFLLLLAKVAVIVIVATGYYDDEIKSELTNTIDNDYGGIDDFTISSLSWNYVMLKYECCGLNDYEDFNTATQWVKERTFTYNGEMFNQTMVTPAACCTTEGTFPDLMPVDANCTFSPTDNNNNWKTGCWDDLSAEFDSQKVTIYGICAAVLVFEFLCGVFAICILCRMGKNDVDHFA